MDQCRGEVFQLQHPIYWSDRLESLHRQPGVHLGELTAVALPQAGGGETLLHQAARMGDVEADVSPAEMSFEELPHAPG